jgi:ParB-like chromosome segregation protein Spo0J
MGVAELIASALAAGALEGLRPTAEQAVKDAYQAIKSFLSRKYSAVSLTAVEGMPESAAKRASLAEDIAVAKADRDAELSQLVQTLVDALKHDSARIKTAIGVDLANISAKNLKISDVDSTGDGVRIHGAKVDQDITIRGVHAGERPVPPL